MLVFTQHRRLAPPVAGSLRKEFCNEGPDSGVPGGGGPRGDRGHDERLLLLGLVWRLLDGERRRPVRRRRIPLPLSEVSNQELSLGAGV
jgi:hypothetical protein